MSDDPAKSVEEETAQSDSPGDGREDAPPADAEASAEGDVPTPDEEEAPADQALEEQLDALQEEFDSLQDRHLRLAADFDNYRRRAENEMRQSWIRAQADLIRRLLDALDDLQRVTDVESGDTSVDALLEGVQLVEKKLGQALEDAGAEVVNPVGEPFDPNTMEAMMKAPAESEDEDDQVDQVFQKGYTFKGHLVRPARVSVKKHE